MPISSSSSPMAAGRRIRSAFLCAGIFALLAFSGSSSATAADTDGFNSCLAVKPASATLASVSATGSVFSASVPVWAMVEGSLPIAGAKAQIYVGSGKKRRALKMRKGTVRTTSGGAVVLHPKRLPRRFEVVVKGGKIDGRPFRGWLSTRVRRYKSGGIVSVNPVTTFVSEYRRLHPRMDPLKAKNRVKRYLRIPAVHDIAIDLRRTDSRFDGDVFMHRLAGSSVSELMRNTLKRLDRTASKGNDAFIDRRMMASAPLASAGAAVVADDLFGDLLTSAGKAAAGEAGTLALGYVLDALGLSKASPDAAALAAIQQQLTQISTQLTELELQASATQAAIAKSEYSVLLGQTNTARSNIDNAENCLSYLPTMRQDSPDLPRFAKGLAAYIGDNLLSTEASLKNALLGAGSGDGIIKAAYKDSLSAAKNPASTDYHFWSHDLSEEPRQVFDFFAAYQGQLAMLVTEYFNTENEQSDSIIASLQSFQNDVELEKQQLKPEVPVDATVDVNTGRIWYLKAHVPCNFDVARFYVTGTQGDRPRKLLSSHAPRLSARTRVTSS